MEDDTSPIDSNNISAYSNNHQENENDAYIPQQSEFNKSNSFPESYNDYESNNLEEYLQKIPKCEFDNYSEFYDQDKINNSKSIVNSNTQETKDSTGQNINNNFQQTKDIINHNTEDNLQQTKDLIDNLQQIIDLIGQNTKDDHKQTKDLISHNTEDNLQQTKDLIGQITNDNLQQIKDLTGQKTKDNYKQTKSLTCKKTKDNHKQTKVLKKYKRGDNLRRDVKANFSKWLINTVNKRILFTKDEDKLLKLEYLQSSTKKKIKKIKHLTLKEILLMTPINNKYKKSPENNNSSKLKENLESPVLKITYFEFFKEYMDDEFGLSQYKKESKNQDKFTCLNQIISEYID